MFARGLGPSTSRAAASIFASKQQAVDAVRALQAQGVRSIDVGCMQVNLMHHPNAFASLDAAFDPTANALYAARFLNSLYGISGSWVQATAAYHSQTPAIGADYQQRVMARWDHQGRVFGVPATQTAYGNYQDRAGLWRIPAGRDCVRRVRQAGACSDPPGPPLNGERHHAIEVLARRERHATEYRRRRDPIAAERLVWHAHIFRHLVHLLPGESILELGSGDGAFTRALVDDDTGA